MMSKIEILEPQYMFVFQKEVSVISINNVGELAQISKQVFKNFHKRCIKLPHKLNITALEQII